MTADGRSGFVLSDEGGRILRWWVEGKNILFPDQTIEVKGVRKRRGGMFWCCPNFGKAPEHFELPQHGPLRDLTGRAPGVLAEIDFEGTEALGKKFRRRSVVRVSALQPTPRRLFYELAVTLPRNKLRRGVPFNPGVHPYFATPQGEAEVRVGGATYPIRSLEEEGRSVPFAGNAEIEIPGIGIIDLKVSHSLAVPGARLVLWRDDLRYLCVEPVLGASKDFGVPGKGKFLTAGERFAASVELRLR